MPDGEKLCKMQTHPLRTSSKTMYIYSTLAFFHRKVAQLCFHPGSVAVAETQMICAQL